MTAVPITLVGTSTTSSDGQTTFTGVAVLQGLGIGGGPMPGQPPRPWGPINSPDQGLPGQPPHASQGPGFPTNPIAPGGQPPKPWGPINYPDQGLPGQQPPFGGGGGGAGSWRWVYSPIYGWVLDPGSGGKPQPPGVSGGGERPDQSLPEAQPLPDQSLPEPQPGVDNT
jgi:hypothetical protein